ncbi:MAG: DUF1573 domain-containing protein [Candidatus Zixiibacteriota bacterium]|nr:MAG: DUF1573 domain-containing protein [candidate division Zixibacteria bacterium]
MNMATRITATLFICLLLAGGAHAEASLRFSMNRFDLGSIPPNSVVSHYFWLRSAGTDTLVIEEIKTGCGCTLMPLDKNWIAPGDSMKVDICWDVKGKIGASGSYPYIFTNAPDGPSRVYLTGTIVKSPDSLRPVSLKPYILDLSRFRETSIDSISFAIRNHSEQDITLSRLSFDVVECEVILPEMVAAGSVAYGRIKVKEEFLDKEFKRSFTLKLNDQKNSRITVPVRRKIY